jgi:hypothetical protein
MPPPITRNDAAAQASADKTFRQRDRRRARTRSRAAARKLRPAAARRCSVNRRRDHGCDKEGLVETVTGAAKAAARRSADAAAKLVGGEDARERAEDFAERAERITPRSRPRTPKADYERAKLNAGRRFAAMPQTGPYQLRFATAETFLDGAIDVARRAQGRCGNSAASPTPSRSTSSRRASRRG